MEPGLQSAGGREVVFGPYVLDPTKRLLWRDGTPVALTPKSLDVLLVLIEHRDRIVEKDELLTRIWGDTVVEESTLVRSVSRLRKALAERPDQHDYVVTIPGHGYRFVASITTRPARSTAASVAAPVPTEDVTPSPDVSPVPAAQPEDAARPASAPWRVSTRPFAATLAVLLGLVGVLALALLTSLPNAEAPPLRELRQLTYDSGLQSDPSWSPDGQSLAYASDKAGNSDIWVKALHAPTPVRLTSSPARESQPAWSPDGTWIAFRSERDGGGLYVVAATGGPERRVAAFGYQPRWSPDGRRILFSSFSLRTGEIPRLYTVGLDGAAPKPVRADITESFRAFEAAWHPDGRISIWGRQLETGWLFVTAPVMGTSAVSSAISPDVERQLRDGDLVLGKFLWAPSGRYLYFEGRSQHVANLWRVAVDPRTLGWTGGPERLTTGPGRDGHIALSPDGTRLAYTVRAERTRLWSLPFDAAAGRITGPGVAITAGTTDEQSPDAPPDGSKVLYFAVRGATRDLRERWLPDGEDRLIAGAGNGWMPNKARWSRDGARLMYIRSRVSPAGEAEQREVMLMDMTGGAAPPVVLGNPDCRPSDWSPDGTLLVGTARHGAPRRLAICLLPTAPGAPPPANRLIAYDPDLNLYQQRFSPDQRWVLFMGVAALEAGASRLYVVPLSGGSWTPITDGDWFDDKPRWAPDGRTIYFASNRGGAFNVWGRRFDPATGLPVGDIFRVTAFDSSQQMLSPDHITQIEIAVTRNRLILPLTDASGEIWVLGNVDR